jgi:hypothetical protein
MVIPFRFGNPNPLSPQVAPGVLYVFAIGGDAATQQKLVSILAQTMEKNEQYYQNNFQIYPNSPLMYIVPQPSWQVSDYVTACTSSLKTAQASNDRVAGALVAWIDQVSVYTTSFVVLRDNHTKIDAHLLYSICDTTPPSGSNTPKKLVAVPTAKHVVTTRTSFSRRPYKAPTYYQTRWKIKKTTIDYTFASPSPDPNTPPTPTPYYYQWKTVVESGDKFTRIWTPLQGIAILLSGVGAWATLTPSVTKTTTNTTVFPTPLPGNPIPPGGVITQSSTVNSKVTNSSLLGTFAGGYLTSSLAYEGTVINIPTTDWQSYNAANDVATSFATEMSCPVQSPVPKITGPIGIRAENVISQGTPTPKPPPPPSACLQVLQGSKVTFQR